MITSLAYILLPQDAFGFRFWSKGLNASADQAEGRGSHEHIDRNFLKTTFSGSGDPKMVISIENSKSIIYSIRFIRFIQIRFLYYIVY